MFSELMKLFSPSKSQAASPKIKHLKIQTFYSSANPNLLHKADIDLNHGKKTAPILVTPEQLEKQREYLLQNSPHKVTSVDVVSLDAQSMLVGLTKHSPIVNGIFMYPHTIIDDENEWPHIKAEASNKQAGIAIFRPLHEVQCLQVTHKQKNFPNFLIDHRTISRVEWLWHSSEAAAQADLTPIAQPR